MKNLSLLSLLLTLLFQSQAQKLNGIVRGSLKDSATTQALSDATVSIVHTRDSALVSFTLSAKGGNFELKNLAPGSYFLLVHHQGYRLFRKSFSITESAPVFDVGQVRLSQEFKTMREVVVNDYTPIKVKGDTITYYANAFPLSRPNATAEELLKRLPGIIVEKNGIIKAHGENVQKVYVDGKEFFNNDPKLATRNLNADMIERVEVYDDLSEQAKFSGIEDGSRSKAINLKLKKEKKQGVFGRASVGSGTDNRYEAGLTANYFKGASKLSVVARTNNINNLGSTANDQVGIPASNNFSNNSSLGSALVGSAPGINNNSTTGVNYSDLWGKNTEITTSYYFNNLTNINNSKSFRQSFFPDSIFRSQEADVESNNQSHRINVRVVQAIDSSSSIIYAPAISFQNTEINRQDSSETHLMAGKYLTPLNDSRTIREQRGAGTFVTNNLTYRKRFAKGGRTFSITLTNTNNNMQKSGQTDARMGRYVNGSKASDSLIRQKNSIHHQASSRGASISYTEPVAPDKFVEINYQHTYDGNLSDREALDWNSNNSKYDLINPQQSNNFKNANVSDRIGSNFRVVKKKYNYQLGLAAQSITLQSRDLTKDSTIEQTFTNLFPAATFNYQFARSKSLRIRYRGRTDQPNISQLQPIRDVSNPLYQMEGNPRLRQEYSNDLSINYNFFDMVSFRSYFFRLKFSNTYNKIVNNISLLPNGVQVVQPVNADGTYHVNGNLHIGFPLNQMKSGNFTMTTTIDYGRDVNIANKLQNFTKSLSLGEYLGLDFNLKEKLDASISTGVDYNTAVYSLISNRNTPFVSYAWSADVSYNFPLGITLATDIEYTSQTGLADSFNQQYMLWNGSISKQLLRNQRGELKFRVYDMLKQNRNVTRVFADNFIEDVQNTALQRFFMLTFAYNLSHMGPRATSVKNQQPAGNW